MLNIKKQKIIRNFATSTSKRKTKKRGQEGLIHVKCSFNNTHLALTDMQGNIKTWSSGGSAGFKGSRRSTTFAAQMAAEQIGREAAELGYYNIDILIKGLGSGRRSIAKGLRRARLRIGSITDVTPLPHNGCRPRKRRRG